MHNLPNISIDIGQIHLEYNLLFIIFLTLIKASGLIIYFTLVFPNLLKETKINDKLKLLRKIFFVCLNAFSMGIAVDMFVSACIFFDCIDQNTSILTAIIQALSVLIVYIALALIYNRKY
jgi:hypothetical protein